MEQYNPLVDAYISRSPAFAQPVLAHLRQLVHEVSPQITEEIKWNSPFFNHKGKVCFIAAFKAHCAFGFWDISMLKDPNGVLKRGAEKESRGHFGRILNLGDLPSDDILKDLLSQAIAINEQT